MRRFKQQRRCRSTAFASKPAPTDLHSPRTRRLTPTHCRSRLAGERVKSGNANIADPIHSPASRLSSNMSTPQAHLPTDELWERHPRHSHRDCVYCATGVLLQLMPRHSAAGVSRIAFACLYRYTLSPSPLSEASAANRKIDAKPKPAATAPATGPVIPRDRSMNSE